MNFRQQPFMKHSNNLANETSPYLLQHAHNPVEWFPWGEEALSKARMEDKPILVSIGYSACHWCHVMEKESFEDEETAGVMNEHFINIKIDREERPDLDHIYMDAVQAITGSGGWPLNVFLTPDLQPFYGGTYFPPIRAHGRASWKEVLLSVSNAFKTKRTEITGQAQRLIDHIINTNSLGVAETSNNLFTKEIMEQTRENILKSADTFWGGFGAAPKFPQTHAIRFLLADFYFTGNKHARNHALLSLEKMSNGGIYDHLGGGYARYSTDKMWFAPHFEKMLYDNALIVSALADAYTQSGKPLFRQRLNETIAFLKREMTSPENGFYSALDADSEGVEGKFYVWGLQEIKEVLKGEAPAFIKAYNVLEEGNWEHTNILWIKGETDLQQRESEDEFTESRQKLLEVRALRERPQLDDKIILGWNALMISALCKAYAAVGEDDFLYMAEKCFAFIQDHFKKNDGRYYHTWKAGKGKIFAFLDDYAAFIHACISLQEVTGKEDYLFQALSLTEIVIADYTDEDERFFYYTSQFQKDVVVRKKELYDGATPSGNALMCYNLLYLSKIFDNKNFKFRAEDMMQAILPLVNKYPTTFGQWALVAQNMVFGMKEIAIIGEKYLQKLKEIFPIYLPAAIVQSSAKANAHFPLLKDRNGDKGNSLVYVCENYACLKPVSDYSDIRQILASQFS